MGLQSLGVADTKGRRPVYIGTVGHLAIFFWLICMVMLVPISKILVTALLCFVVGIIVYPGALRRVVRPRWMILMLLLSVPPLFYLGEIDSSFMGIRYSFEGKLAGLQIAMRFIVVLVAVQGLTSAVDIAALAGLLERFGMQGLGFSTGVALNLLPYMQQASIHAWQCLRMRGGLRKRRWRGLRLLMMTIVSNALRRAEEVALAAEARAFSPEMTKPLRVHRGSLDWLAIVAGMISLILMVLL